MKMQMLRGNRAPVLILCYLMGLFSLVRSPDAQISDTIDSMIGVKKVLAEQLDSLEMEKQARKRMGEPILELEEESQKIFDSLAIIRGQLTESIPESLKAKSENTNAGFLTGLLKLDWKPTSVFDWIIIVVGCIAVLSGAILIGGILHSLFSRSGAKSRPTKTPLSQAGKLKPLPATLPPIINSNVTEAENGGLASLRKRMRQDIDHIQRFNANASPIPTPPPPPYEPIRKPEDNQNSQPIRDVILNAAKDGLSVQEISKKYHVSVDQVTLVLRIAKKGTVGNS